MKIKRTELLKQLESVVPGLSSGREVVEQPSHFTFRADGKVMTYNDEVACVGDCLLTLNGACPAAELLGLLRKLPDDEIVVEVAEGELRIKGGSRKAGIRMEAISSLPVDAVEQPGKWRRLPEGFWDAVTTVGQCASKDESQFILTCIHLTEKHVEACDRFQLARYPIETGLIGVLLKSSAVKELAGMGMVGVSCTESWVHFRDKAGLVLSCRKYEGQYPDLDAFLQVKGTKTKLPKGLADAVAKAEVFSGAEKDDNVLRVDLRPDKLRLTGRGPNGWYSETVAIEYAGEPTEFTIAPKMLLEICRRADECVIGDGRIKVATDKFEYVSCVGKVQAKEKE